jgi:hypothetical protein
MDTYFDLGPHSRSITSSSAEAFTSLNLSLNWCYIFHHKEALRCFEKVVELDANCAMGHWGIGASPT